MFVKQTSITEVSRKIAQSVDESLSKQQKEYFLRQQLAAIQRELHNLNRSSSHGAPMSNDLGGRSVSGRSDLDDDEAAEQEDMAEIRSRIEAMGPDTEERKMAVREWRRLKRIPHGSVEHGVIRNYVGIFPSLTSFPLSLSLPYVTYVFAAVGMAHRYPMAVIFNDKAAFGVSRSTARSCVPDKGPRTARCRPFRTGEDQEAVD